MDGGSMAYYLLKLFASRPARWLDRVVIGAFVAAPAMAHVEIAKRRCGARCAALPGPTHMPAGVEVLHLWKGGFRLVVVLGGGLEGRNPKPEEVDD